VGPRAGLDWCGKSRPTGIRSPDRPAGRQSLYRLRYPAHHITTQKPIYYQSKKTYFNHSYMFRLLQASQYQAVQEIKVRYTISIVVY